MYEQFSISLKPLGPRAVAMTATPRHAMHGSQKPDDLNMTAPVEGDQIGTITSAVKGSGGPIMTALQQKPRRYHPGKFAGRIRGDRLGNGWF